MSIHTASIFTAIVNNASMNRGVQILCHTDFNAFVDIPRNVIAGLYGSSILIFEKTAMLFSIMPVLISILTDYMRAHFSPHHYKHWLSFVFLIMTSDVL